VTHDLFAPPRDLHQGGGNTVRFRVPGEPRAWERAGEQVIVPKEPGKRPFVKHFMPREQEAYQHAIAWTARAVWRTRPMIAARCPVWMTVYVYRTIPASFSMRDRELALAGKLFPTGKADWDNYGKQVSDALNGIVYVDDAQIVRGTVEKHYAADPCLEVEITWA
jgi:Holliday junction resolvase RusA-like endonuclease